MLIFEEHGSNAPAAEAEPIVAAAQLESETQFDVYLFAMWPLFDEGQFEAWLAGELTQGYTLTSEFRDELAALDPPAEIYLIPMDPLFRERVVDGPLAGLTFHDLFVGDDALSAGSATTDFVKALVVYMGVFRRKPSLPLTVPEDVHPAVDQNQGELVDVIWDRLVLEEDRLGF